MTTSTGLIFISKHFGMRILEFPKNVQKLFLHLKLKEFTNYFIISPGSEVSFLSSLFCKGTLINKKRHGFPFSDSTVITLRYPVVL